ncbi:SH3 domain-binding protein 5-like isoform X2 [Onychostruthus taczanowskii]|uniref:SH3 domain-binding protein 5-like isoform X2 n=1 Tax=Onychostruthus taczanowskii TaxID=356909 RepID=UPI001B805FBA|nr:SH3 domain-binding protein 5-like isoform X2 [Onychostruthus taczanowskii]
MHNAAREMVFVAEQGMGTGKNRLDPTWQEMLNHATRKVNEAEQERLWSEREHQRVTRLCQEAEAEVQRLQKSLRRDIARSRPYFELKAQFNQRLEIFTDFHRIFTDFHPDFWTFHGFSRIPSFSPFSRSTNPG